MNFRALFSQVSILKSRNLYISCREPDFDEYGDKDALDYEPESRSFVRLKPIPMRGFNSAVPNFSGHRYPQKESPRVYKNLGYQPEEPKRNYETSTPVYEAVNDALDIHFNRDIKRRPSRPLQNLPTSPGVTGPESFLPSNSNSNPNQFRVQDQRHLIPSYRRKLRYQENPYPDPEINEEDVQDKFHEDRRRNLQSFFKDNSMNEQHNPILGRFQFDETEASDRIVPPPSGSFRDLNDEDEDSADDFEAKFGDGETRIKDPFEFPSHFFAKEHSDAPSGFGDSSWENFFSGHADNVEKDIHSLSRQSDDHTAPPSDYQQEEQEPENEEHNQHQHDSPTGSEFGVRNLST